MEIWAAIFKFVKSKPIFDILLKKLHSMDRINEYKLTKIVSEYDQKIPQSKTADNPVAARGRAAEPSRDTRKTN